MPGLFFPRMDAENPVSASSISLKTAFNKAALFDSLQLDTAGLSKQAFIQALTGYQSLRLQGKLENEDILSIVDFSLPSNEKRFFVIDLTDFSILFKTYVAHGRNSGLEYAKKFSNTPQSKMSSLGFYVTRQTYYGENGLSLRLEGKEKGINDNALRRAIVIHCADYVSENMIHKYGYIGRSLGCPALPNASGKEIIRTIKDGSCLFLYSPNLRYKQRSSLLQHS